MFTSSNVGSTGRVASKLHIDWDKFVGGISSALNRNSMAPGRFEYAPQSEFTIHSVFILVVPKVGNA